MQALPSFSVILETENLAVADPEALLRALESLHRQTTPIADASEVFLIDSGDARAPVLAEVARRWPRIEVVNLEPALGYYEAKMAMVNRAKGEVLVFCDSDCQYHEDWLGGLLAPFASASVNVVCGETAIEPSDAYRLALALLWAFPPHSGRHAVYPCTGYPANNVAFRRQFLIDKPIPTDLTIYRGNCSLHARQLRAQGETLWRQPASRAFHPPIPPAHFLARFFMMPQHELVARRTARAGIPLSPVRHFATDALATLTVIARRLLTPPRRLPRVCSSGGTVILLRLPLAALWLTAGLAAFSVGGAWYLLGPTTNLRKLGQRLEGDSPPEPAG